MREKKTANINLVLSGLYAAVNAFFCCCRDGDREYVIGVKGNIYRMKCWIAILQHKFTGICLTNVISYDIEFFLRFSKFSTNLTSD